MTTEIEAKEQTVKPPYTLKMFEVVVIFALSVGSLLYLIYCSYEQVKDLKAEIISIPKVAVIDMQQLLDERIKAGEEPAKAIRYSKLLAQAAIEEGYILIEKSLVLAIPESARLPEVPAEQLEAFLKERGIEVESLEYFQNQIKEEEAKNKSVIDRIMGN